MRLFVGNIPFTTTDGDLHRFFSKFGTVSGVMISTDQRTGQPRGFAFVEMPDDGEAAAAIDACVGKVVQGRRIVVNEAQPKEARDGRFGGSGGYWKR